MTKIIIVVLPLVAAVSACQYPDCVEADRLASQCGGGGHCAGLQQAQKRACDDIPGGGHSFGSRAIKFARARAVIEVAQHALSRSIEEYAYTGPVTRGDQSEGL
jgi:hypothetical protein